MQIINSLRDKSFFLSKKVGFISVISLCVAVGWSVWQANSAKPSQAPVAVDKAKMLGNFFKMPLTFEVNQGQTDAQVKYLSHGHGYNMFFTKDELVFAFKGVAVRAQFVNANPQTEIAGTDKIRAKTNYLIGNDQTKWHRNIPNYDKVSYKNLYPGIDAVFYGSQQQFEYDIHVAPNADPQAFKLNFQGVHGSSIDKNGALVLKVNQSKSLNMHKPVIYQTINGVKQNIAGDFVLLANNQVSFKIGAYDKSKELVIDPILYYSTYFGGADNWSVANDVAVDADGIVYVVGETVSPNLPLVPEPPYQIYQGEADVFVAKFDPSKSGMASLVYSTYLGGSDFDFGYSIAIDSQKCPWITGYTRSIGFPTENAYQSTYDGYFPGSSVFVTKFNASGSDLDYSTYFAPPVGYASDSANDGYGIAVDGSDKAYVVGSTDAVGTNFPTLHPFVYNGHVQDTNNVGGMAFLAKFDATQDTTATLIYSTLLGATASDSSETDGNAVAVTSDGTAYVTGYTESANFPTQDAAEEQDALNGSEMAFVTKFQAYSETEENLQLDYSTYLGSTMAGDKSYTYGYGIAVDKKGTAYVTGLTTSADFYHTDDAYQTSLYSAWAAFVTKLGNHESGFPVEVIYSTYLGGNKGDDSSDDSYTYGRDIAVDSIGGVYVTGYTSSAYFPNPHAYQANFGGGDRDVFVTKFTPDLSAGLVYSTYLGGSGDDYGYGIAVDKTGTKAYVVGETYNYDGFIFPTTSNAYSQTQFNGDDAFVSVLQEQPSLSWQKHIINTNPANKQVDVFDITTLNYDRSCGNAGDYSDTCVWANARYESNSQLSRAYLGIGVNALGVGAVPVPVPVPVSTWLSCAFDSSTAASSSGRFGVNNVYDANVYLPTTTGTQLLTHDATTSCTAKHYGNTSTSSHDTVGFVRLRAQFGASPYAYYSKWNANVSPAQNDQVFMSSDDGVNWTMASLNIDSSISNLRINYMVRQTPIPGGFIAPTYPILLATSNGLYTCTNAPSCTAWSHNSTLPEPNVNLNRVWSRSGMLIVSTYPSSGGAGLYISIDQGVTWSAKIMPPEAVAGGVTYISGFDIDANGDVYVTWYGTSAGQQASSSLLRNLTSEGLMAGSCSPTKSGATASTTVGGVSVGKLYFEPATGKPAVQFYDNNFYHGTDKFFSNSILGLTLLLDGNGIMQRIYVPSLGPSCNGGGYSIGSP